MGLYGSHRAGANKTSRLFLIDQRGEAGGMIEKDSLEFNLWAEAYKLKAELTPPPDYDKTDNEYWRQVLEKIHKSVDRYKDTYVKILAENIYLGVLLQLEQESINRAAAEGIIKSVADKLTGKEWED